MDSIEKTPAQERREHVAHEAEAGVSAAVVGAAVGAIGGPPGAVAGAVIGGVVGVLAELALEHEADAVAQHEAELDDEIGVSGGEMGAPNLEHPAAVVGAYSAGASGGGDRSSSVPPAEGPMQAAE
jgi:hypothetical protein